MSYNEWLDIEVLEDYLDGKLDAKTMHQVEKLSLEDPFVAEALAGLSQSPRRSQSLSLLQKQLQERIAQKPVEQKRWRITSQRLSIAATAAVLFVTVSLLFWMKESKRQELLAGQPKKVDVSIAPEAVKSNPEVKTTPPAEAAIDKALADAKTNTLATIKKPKAVENREVRSAVAAASTLDSKEVESNTTAKESPVIAAAPTQLSRALNGKVAGLTIAKNLMQVTGKVTDEGGAPIIGASVKLRGANLATNTNTKGEFVINIDSNLSNQKLAIGYLGFKQKEVEIKVNEQVKVALQEEESTLNEVVVTGSGLLKKKAVTPALSGSIKSVLAPNPAEGWDKFEQYLLNNNKLLNNKTTTGRAVQLSFTVNGKGRPVDIKVVSTLTKLENDEAIRLIKDGPNWVVPAKSSSQAIVNVKF